MFIYNITIKVDAAIAEEWMKWQIEEHIPGIMATNLFEQYSFYRLHDQNDIEGPTYVFQYHTRERKNYDQYIIEYAPALREKAVKKWGDGFIAFGTLMESVQ